MTRPNSSLLAGVAVFAAIVAVAIFAPLLAQHDPLAIPEGGARLSPGGSHWFGTDQQGRDLFARVAYGARTSLLVGLGSAVVATVLGVCIGAVAGYCRGWIDTILMRVAEVFLVIPGIMLAACLVVALGRNAFAITIAIGVAGWPQIARVTRGLVMQAKQVVYVEAARVLGASGLRILLRHVLPQIVSTIAVLAIVAVATGILAESALSFLSIGIGEPTPSWGLMITGGKRFLSSSPHLVLFPAGAIFLTVSSLFLISEGLRHADRHSAVDKERVHHG